MVWEWRLPGMWSRPNFTHLLKRLSTFFWLDAKRTLIEGRSIFWSSLCHLILLLIDTLYSLPSLLENRDSPIGSVKQRSSYIKWVGNSLVESGKQRTKEDKSCTKGEFEFLEPTPWSSGNTWLTHNDFCARAFFIKRTRSPYILYFGGIYKW